MHTGMIATVSSIDCSAHVARCLQDSALAARVRLVDLDEVSKTKTRKEILRLRHLSIDYIDPIVGDPSFIDKAYSSNAAETNGQRIERVLETAYSEFIEVVNASRKAQLDAHTVKEQRDVSMRARCLAEEQRHASENVPNSRERSSWGAFGS